MSIAAVVNAGRRLIATAFLDSCAIADRVEVRDSRGGTRATWVNRHKTPPQVVSGGNGSTATVVARDDSGKILGTWVLPLSTLETIEDTGSVAPLGELTKQAAKEFTASLVGQGVVSVLPMKSLSGNITITGEFTKFATKRLTGGVAPAGGLRKVVSIHLHGAIGTSGETRKVARIIRAGEIATGGNALLTESQSNPRYNTLATIPLHLAPQAWDRAGVDNDTIRLFYVPGVIYRVGNAPYSYVTPTAPYEDVPWTAGVNVEIGAIPAPGYILSGVNAWCLPFTNAGDNTPPSIIPEAILPVAHNVIADFSDLGPDYYYYSNEWISKDGYRLRGAAGGYQVEGNRFTLWGGSGRDGWAVIEPIAGGSFTLPATVGITYTVYARPEEYSRHHTFIQANTATGRTGIVYNGTVALPNTGSNYGTTSQSATLESGATALPLSAYATNIAWTFNYSTKQCLWYVNGALVSNHTSGGTFANSGSIRFWESQYTTIHAQFANLKLVEVP